MMSKLFIIILGCFFSALVVAAGVEDIDQWAMVTIGKEDPYYIIPREFSVQNTEHRKTPYSYEQFTYQEGDNGSNWLQRIHLMATNGKPDPNGNSVDLTKQLIGDGVRKNCPNDYFQIQKEAAKDKKLTVLMGCRKFAGDDSLGLVAYHFFIESAGSMYVVAREAKVTSYESVPFSESELESWKAHLERTVICAKGDVCIHKKIK